LPIIVWSRSAIGSRNDWKSGENNGC